LPGVDSTAADIIGVTEMVQKKAQRDTAQSSELTATEKITYTTGILGQNMIYDFMSMYILFFFTDILKIPPKTAGTILVAASLWDAVNDPLMGMIADKTRSRWGKFRPYLLFDSLVIGAVTTLCYVKFGGPLPAVIAYAAVVYILWGMTFTMCDIPIWALSSVSSPSPTDRTAMVTLGKIGSVIGVVIVSVGSVTILKIFGGERSAPAYTAAAGLFAGAGSLLMLITGIFSHERILPPKKTVPFSENSKTIYKNKPLLLLLITLFLLNFINSVRQSVQIYFAVYTWGNAGYVTMLGLSLVVGMLIGMGISPALMKRVSKQKLFIGSCAGGAVISLLPFVTNYLNIPLGLVCIGISFAFTGTAMIVSTSMLMDAIDYAELKLGFRGEGIAFSMNTFLTKLGGTLAKLLLGAALIVMHYVENQQPTPVVQRGFSFLVYIVPAIAFVLCAVPILFYPLKNSDLHTMEEKLKKQRVETANANDEKV
jgi:sugar (glycoside-pentoside-hexuronide) transporter